ncbi:hypothetical protein [Mesorhizobium silamurunense]|uniref:hypothetical protein n=1 Tax=Mesorhizobium silamurunense TaxID=499528 RepID=UPI001785BFE8|nr:hypothetical protein [Mesorhizobium silamurunense]
MVLSGAAFAGKSDASITPALAENLAMLLIAVLVAFARSPDGMVRSTRRMTIGFQPAWHRRNQAAVIARPSPKAKGRHGADLSFALPSRQYIRGREEDRITKRLWLTNH